jgi:large subunit ribosomal protein L18
MKTKEEIRTRIHSRIRKKVAGTTARPRLAVFRSQSHIYAQVIDDDGGKTLAAASSLDKDLKGEHKRGANVAAAKAVGKLIATRAKEKGIDAVVFDRGGFQYHGRIKALADAAREGGLKFQRRGVWGVPSR